MIVFTMHVVIINLPKLYFFFFTPHCLLRYNNVIWQGVHTDFIFLKDINSNLTTKLYDKRDDFNLSLVNFRYLCSNI